MFATGDSVEVRLYSVCGQSLRFLAALERPQGVAVRGGVVVAEVMTWFSLQTECSP